jgi:predicted RNase H-like HicB family nuclease
MANENMNEAAEVSRMSYKVSVVIEHDENGYYAWCPELPGCQTQGDTLDEIMANAREAVGAYLETLDPEERQECLSKEVLTTSVEVALA